MFLAAPAPAQSGSAALLDAGITAIVRNFCSLRQAPNTEIRHFGYDGAHPGEDPLEDGVSSEEAEQAFEFAHVYFDYVYVLPHRMDTSCQKRAGLALPTAP